MKRINLILIISAFGMFVSSCSKETAESVNITPEYDRLIVYDNNWCTTLEGVKGLECIVGNNQDCSMQSDCASNASYPNYNDLLHAKYTDEEIEAFANENVRITDTDLIQALVQDGYPIY